MRTSGLAVMTMVLAVAAGACGSDDDVSTSTRPVGDPGLDVCSLVSDTTVKKLQSTSEDPQGEPVESLMTNAETFVECLVISGVEVGFAVRAVPDGPPLESLVDDESGFPAKPLPGVGDEAMIGTNSYDGVRITARVGDQELVVDSNAYVSDDEGDISRDDVIALATEVASNLGAEKPGAIRLPEQCPSVDVPQVQETIGRTVVARGVATSNGSVSCTYVGVERKLRLAAVAGDRVMSLLALADSPDGDRLEVDGDDAVFDLRDGIVVYADDDCVLGASASDVSWGLGSRTDEADRRQEAIGLVKYVRSAVGCPEG